MTNKNKVLLSLALLSSLFVFRVFSLGVTYMGLREVRRKLGGRIQPETSWPGPGFLQTDKVKILSSHQLGGEGLRTLQVEWMGSFQNGLQFLTDISREGWLASPSTLRLEAREGSSLVEGTAVFPIRLLPEPMDPMELAQGPFERNPFQAQWLPSSPDPRPAPNFAEEERKRRLEQERMAAQRTATAEREKREARKSELQRNWSLTGIVHDGTRALAFLENRKGGGNLMVKAGDRLETARVASIDETTEQVVLSLDNETQVTLSMENQTNGF